jgi:magnesium transporter
MLRVRVYDGGTVLDGDEALLDRPGPKWVDVLQPSEDVLQRLGERFGLHKLALEDCLHLDQRPKLEDYGTHQFLVLQGFSCAAESFDDVTMHELHMFLGADWLITVHEKGAEVVALAHKRVDADPKGTFGRGVDFLAYLVADSLVDRNFPLLDRFSDALEELEERIFDGQPGHALLQRAFELRRTLVMVRRTLSPQRDVVALLARPGLPQVSDRTTLYFRDVYDHLVRIYEQLDASRDLIGNVLEAYHSSVANRTNDITKQLTIFASLFLPLSFIVGFFGQNFDVLSQAPFFWTMLGLMVALPTGMVWWFRRKGWWGGR